MKLMKLFGAAVMAVVLSMGFTACSDDDDNTINGNGNNGGTIKTENSVTLETAGTLSLVLGDKVQYITSLKITGPLNGDDIICLRQMLRCTREDSDKRGMLTVLDISDASIVAGGNRYDSDYYSTSNDIIGTYMFRYCESLTQIALPNSVTEIDVQAFRNCTRLTNVIIGSSVKTISYEAFCECSKLTSITIPNSVTRIGEYAFERCKSLTEVTIGKGVTTIGNYAFSDCTGLTEVTIGDSVTKIGNSAFSNCTSLTSIYSLNPEPPECGSNAFDRVDTSTCTLYVPKGSKEAYSTASQWKNFTNIVEI